MAPLISVAIVTFNRKAQVDRAIRSVLAQRRNDVEIVVVDNDSADGSAEYIAQTFSEVRLLRLPRNVGCPDGRNHAYANCTGEYIINLDDDGWLDDAVIEPLLAIFEQDESIGVVALRQAYPEESGDERGRAMSSQVQDVTAFLGGVSAFRRKMLARIGAYPPDFFLFAEETYLSLRALDAGYRIVSAPHIIMWHPKVGGSHLNTQFDFHLYRNNFLVVFRLYPLSMMLTHLPLKAASMLLCAVKRGSVPGFVRALIDVMLSLPRTFAQRDPVRAQTVRRHRAGARKWSAARREGRLVAAPDST